MAPQFPRAAVCCHPNKGDDLECPVDGNVDLCPFRCVVRGHVCVRKLPIASSDFIATTAFSTSSLMSSTVFLLSSGEPVYSASYRTRLVSFENRIHLC